MKLNALRLKSLAELHPASVRRNEKPTPTAIIITDKSGRKFRYWSDGSLRRDRSEA